MSRLDNKEELNYPGNQYRFFQRVCLNENGELCIDENLVNNLSNINDTLVNIASVLSGNTNCEPTPTPPVDNPSCQPQHKPCYDTIQPIEYHYYHSGRPYKTITQPKHCTIVKQPTKVIRIDLDNPRQKAEVACGGCYTKANSKYKKCVDALEAKFIEYNESLKPKAKPINKSGGPRITRTPKDKNPFVITNKNK